MQPGVAVVTGASAGVGRATARALARSGFDVAVLARGIAGLRAAASDVELTGRRALAIPTDVSEYAQVADAAEQVEAELGPIDVWVNNAMTTVFAWFTDVQPDEFARTTAVTYLGQVYGTMVALEHMQPRDRGRIVNVGSALAFAGLPLQSAYCGAKFACRGFTQAVRAELLARHSNITISLVHLPAVNTPQFEWCLSRMEREPMPVPPVYQPEVVAEKIVAAALTGRRSKVVGGWNRAVVAAGRLAPSVAAQFAARTGIDSQQTDEPRRRDRRADLCDPVDVESDYGARGRFDERAQGMRDVAWLRTLPRTGITLVRSIGAAAREAVTRDSAATAGR